MTTILNTLEDAYRNLSHLPMPASFGSQVALVLARARLKNAIELLSRGYDPDDDVDAAEHAEGIRDVF